MSIKKGRHSFSTSGFQHAGLKGRGRNNQLTASTVRSLKQVVRDLKSKEESGISGQTERRGILVLFAGGSGTGKTMAANVLAGELAMNLFKVDLAALVSKYIGETEKNLAGVFERAARKHLILYFDEADALFGKRTDVKDSHDRYANVEVSQLLKRMEDFDGVVVIAVNDKTVIDPKYQAYFQNVVDI